MISEKFSMKKTMIALAMLSLPALGAEITADEARVAAEAWLAKSQPVGGTPSGVRTLTDCAFGAAVHVVDLVGGGYVVLAADDLRGPVMAFAAKGAFADDPRNPFWQIVMGDALVSDGEIAAEAAGTFRTATQREWDDLLGRGAKRLKTVSLPAGSAVGRRPLVKSRWSQSTHDGTDTGLPCYNYYVPVNPSTGKRGPCGCVATAAAQLMYYHKFPAKAVVRSFDVELYGKVAKLSTSGESYRWSDMTEDPATDCSTAARTAIGRLTMDIGIACGAGYGESATSASAYSLGCSRLKDTFGYGDARWFEYGSAEEFRRNLIPNLDAGLPVVMSIMNVYDGHAVVVDGYAWDSSRSTFYVSVNMGWGGQDTGWYVPPKFEYVDEWGYLEEFSNIEGFVGNVMPSASGLLVSGRVTGANGRPASGASVSLKLGTSVLQTKTADANGVYWFAAAEGSYTVAATAGAASGSASATLGAGGNVQLPDIQLSALTDSVATPTISVSGSTVTMSCTTTGATIRYTIDGTEPDAGSELYGASFSAGAGTVKARAFKTGMQASATANWMLSLDQPDDFAQAWEVSTASGSVVLNNVGATDQYDSGEPYHSSSWLIGGASVWVKFKAPTAGNYVIRSTGTHQLGYGLNTQLAVYSGSRLDALKRIDADDRGGSAGWTSQVLLPAQAGTSYWIAIDTYGGGPAYFPDTNCGDILLEWAKGDFVRPATTWLDLPSASAVQTVAVTSSAPWKVVDKSDWISVVTGSGTSGQSLKFTAAANTANTKRVGAVMVKAGTSGTVAITVAQVPANWYLTKSDAEAAAKASGRRIILVYGRDGCDNTSWTRECLSADPSIKPLVDAGYVCWYCNCDGDRYGEAYGYTVGLGYYSLPMVCIIDPKDMSAPLYRTSDWQEAETIRGYVTQYKPSGVAYRVVFAANGGSGTMPDFYLGKGSVGNLPRCAFTLGGKAFKGWAGSNGRRYDDGVLVFDLAQPDKTVTMTAIWE